ncbi:hypothetical protein N7510_000416 [Penicillium lagena]|uniref:uncharacterized protein n=1 Tax=Penicillium lagena TaxID=94218 RepID=UPI002540C76E|nr:uncharacterized protein N7510_000416 [Penicillium lagena]KAJ5624107.1 hypothetical protein N7510_000416 [Penicillium lagena]
MELTIRYVSSLLVVVWVLHTLITFLRLYIIGRRTGFPVYIIPIQTRSVPWMFLNSVLRPYFEKYLPECIYERIDIASAGWEFRRKAEMHQRLGPAFVVVTLNQCALWVGDPALGNIVLQRRKDFVQAPIVKRMMGFLGSNVLQANGDDWQRQRRIVAPNLNERISEAVWNESCEQAQEMLDYLSKRPGSQTLSGLRCLAINVLGQAGYGQAQPWLPELPIHSKEELNGRAGYFSAMSLITDMLPYAALLPHKLLRMSFMPLARQALGRHLEKINQYTKDMLDDERKAAKYESGPRNNFLNSLVQFSDQGTDTKPALTMSEDEISGNLFIFSVAGFDTTANTMGYAVCLLAAYPEWQHWVREELAALPDISQWKYEETFPKCQRTLAVMFETLRHFTPVLHSTRAVSETQTLVDADGTQHIITPPMDVFVSQQSIHYNPNIWGADVEEFKPTRWLDNSGNTITPPKGTFIPWSGGPRVCPGMKMSQVEFVAAMAVLFRSGRCEPVTEGGMSLEESRKALHGVLYHDSISKITMQVKNPTKVKLAWYQEI